MTRTVRASRATVHEYFENKSFFFSNKFLSPFEFELSRYDSYNKNMARCHSNKGSSTIYKYYKNCNTRGKWHSSRTIYKITNFN